MTPEGRVKALVKRVLADYGDELDGAWPVQDGMGTPALDCVICYRGHHIEVETKAPGKKPTPRQLNTIAKKEKAGAAVFVIDGEHGCQLLYAHLECIRLGMTIDGVVSANASRLFRRD